MKRIALIALVLIGLTACKKNQIESDRHLNEWNQSDTITNQSIENWQHQ